MTRHFIVVLAGIGFFQISQAQTIPPACDQYFKALDACTQNAINYYERTNIKAAKSMRDLLKAVQEQKADVRKRVSTQGEDATAEYCTSPDFVGRMSNGLSGVLVPLTFKQAVDANCTARYNEIQH